MQNKDESLKNENKIQGLKGESFFELLSQADENLVVFINDIETGISAWSKSAVEFFDFPSDYRTHVQEVWESKIHPEDLEGYQKEIDAVFSRKKEHQFQYRVLGPDGQYIWVECKGTIGKDIESQKEFFVGRIIRLDQTTIYDPVSNCLNFREFDVNLFRSSQSFILIGIDSFRKVINQIGFSESNNILRILGEILRKANPERPIYRMTGDEFLIVLPPSSAEELNYLHNKVLNDFSKAVEKEYKGIRVQFSAAVTYYNPKTDTNETVIKRLEHTLEYAKHLGDGAFALYSSAIEDIHNRASKLQGALTHAIENQFEGFSLVYQPIIDYRTGKIDGAEALLRFYDKDLGLISPAEFIPMLESSGAIVPVGMWVAKKAIEQKLVWDKIHPGIKVGFNTSIKQYETIELSEKISLLVKENHIKPDEIIVELTESQRMHDPEHMRQMLKPLTDSGIWVFLDDFGMEASTFTLVQELPVNGIKIDHSFVRTMIGNAEAKKDKANKAIIASIAYLGKLMDMRVIVEGVENEKIDQILKEMNLNFAQGYYYSRPICVKELESKWLK